MIPNQALGFFHMGPLTSKPYCMKTQKMSHSGQANFQSSQTGLMKILSDVEFRSVYFRFMIGVLFVSRLESSTIAFDFSQLHFWLI